VILVFVSHLGHLVNAILIGIKNLCFLLLSLKIGFGAFSRHFDLNSFLQEAVFSRRSSQLLIQTALVVILN